MTNTIVFFSTATKFCTAQLGDFSSAFYLQQGCISQEKRVCYSSKELGSYVPLGQWIVLNSFPKLMGYW